MLKLTVELNGSKHWFTLSNNDIVIGRYDVMPDADIDIIVTQMMIDLRRKLSLDDLIAIRKSIKIQELLIFNIAHTLWENVAKVEAENDNQESCALSKT